MWIGWRGFYPGEAPAVSNPLGLGFFVCFLRYNKIKIFFFIKDCAHLKNIK